MILTFAKLQRLSGLQKPTAVYSWLKRQGVPALRDAKGRPFTTLDAVNRRLAKSGDDGFRLDDPERGLPEKRAMVSRRPKQVGSPDAGGRGASRPAAGVEGDKKRLYAEDYRRLISSLPTASRSHPADEAGI